MSEKRRRESMLKAHAVGDGAAAWRAMAVGRVGLQVLWALENASSFVHFRSFYGGAAPSSKSC